MAKMIGSVAQQAALKKLNAMKEKKGSSGGGSKYIKLEDGDKKIIRFAPPWADDVEFYKESVQHFGLGPEGKTSAICPGRDKCPACKKVWNDRDQLIAKAAKELKAQGKPSDKNAALKYAQSTFKKQWNQAGRIGGKTRYKVNAVEIDQTTKKPVEAEWVTFDFGPQIMQQVLTYFTDTIEWGVFYDEDSIYDFVIGRVGTEMATEYKVMPTRKVAKVDTSELENLRDLDAFVTPNTPEEVETLLNGEALEEKVEEEEEEQPKKKGLQVKLKKKAVDEDDEDEEVEASDDEDSDEEEVEEEEEEVAPPPPAKKKAKSSLEAELASVAKGKKK